MTATTVEILRSGNRLRRMLAGLAVLLAANGASSAQQPAPGGVLGGFSRDNGPINIQSDALTINDQKKIAIYKGNVIAVQGDNTLRTVEMEVQYTSKEDEQKAQNGGAGKAGEKKAKPASTAVGDDSQQIKRIRAKEKVVMVSSPAGKDAQSATSDFADYDVVSQTVELIGNVFIKQGKNVITGSKVTMNLKTSEYTVDGASPANVGGVAPAAGTPAARPGRVSTVLFPKEKTDGKTAPAAIPAAPAGSAIGPATTDKAATQAGRPPSKEPSTSSWTTTSPR